MVLLSLWLLAALFSLSMAAENEFSPPSNVTCACPGDVLTYNCTVIEGGATLWSGTAFDCATDEIILRHNRFNDSTSGECNQGAITAQSVGAQATCCISQLRVTVSSGLNNKTVNCFTINPMVTVGESRIRVINTSENSPTPPNNISLTNINQTHVTFSWTSVSASCSSFEYIINADCGDCPLSTNTTSITCTNLPPPSDSETTVCTFAVGSRVCGIDGNLSAPVMLTIPDIPRVNIVPCYSNDSQKLQQLLLEITMNKTTVIANDISGSITNYIVITTLMDTVARTMIPAQPCEGSICKYVFNIPHPVCSSLKVAVSASNKVGEGRPSDTVTIGCFNEFIGVKYDSSTSTITCTFFNTFDTSKKTCHIQYGVCDQMMEISSDFKFTMSESVTLKLRIINPTSYCYTLTASNDSNTVIVKGKIEGGAKDPVPLAAIITAIVMVIVMTAFFLGIVIIFMIRRKSKIIAGAHYDVELLSMKSVVEILKDDDIVHLKLSAIDMNDRKFVEYVVDHDCALKEFIEEKCLAFKEDLHFMSLLTV